MTDARRMHGTHGTIGANIAMAVNQKVPVNRHTYRTKPTKRRQRQSFPFRSQSFRRRLFRLYLTSPWS